MHALIFWGFLALLTTIVEVGGQVIDPAFELPLIGGTRALGLVQDVFAAGVLVGLAIAVAIRLGQRPERFVGSHRLEAYRILGAHLLDRRDAVPRPRRADRRRPRARLVVDARLDGDVVPVHVAERSGGSAPRCGRSCGATSR